LAIIETCKKLDVNPFKYIFGRIVKHINYHLQLNLFHANVENWRRLLLYKLPLKYKPIQSNGIKRGNDQRFI